MASSMKQLYLFLTACSGNWRNSICIKCQGEKNDPGYQQHSSKRDKGNYHPNGKSGQYFGLKQLL